MSRPENDFDGSPEVIFDPAANRALLLDPATPVEVRGGGRGRRFAIARIGLSVIAVSGLCLLSTTIPLAGAESDGAQPVVSAACQITDQLADGTPSGVLASGEICVLPPAAGPPSPATPADEPADEPAAGGTEPQAPAAPAEPAAPAQPAAPASAPAAADAPAAPAAADAPAAPAAAPPTTSTSAAAPAATTSSSSTTRGATKTKTSPTRSAGKAKKAARKRTATSRSRRAQRRAETKLRQRDASRAKRLQDKPQLQADAGVTSLDGPLKPPFYVNDEAVIPRFLIKLYKQAGKRYDIPWPLLAAINEIETDFGRNVAVSSAGAVGWMQFMPATWKAYGVDADRDGKKDPNNPHDAIFAAARYLQAAGAPKHMRRAIFAYNHAGWYVDSVLLRAERIAAQQGERSKALWRLFETSGRRLEQQVLADPRITLYECGRQDIEDHKIDRRVLVLLRFLAWSGLHPTVSSLECGHGYYTKSGNVSHHSSGNAVDISAINGVPIMGHQGSGSVTEATIRELLTLRGAMRPDQIISLMTFEGASNTLAMSDHADHIHVGFAPLKPTAKVPVSWRFGKNRRITIGS